MKTLSIKKDYIAKKRLQSFCLKNINLLVGKDRLQMTYRDRDSQRPALTHKYIQHHTDNNDTTVTLGDIQWL